MTPRFHSPEVERAAHGLRVRGHGLYLDARGRPPMGFLAHARGAPSILPERMIASGPTIQLLTAALPRALRRTAALPAAWGQTFALGSLRLTLHPAGHVLGSAQVRCQADGLDLVYAGDLGGSGARASLTAEPQVPLTCETLALRAVYGHPRYVFPP
ncbi:MAG TPA: MBL fold metallo-hydrolase, partial [Myxococcales bacterium]|nr:MBL fold metallo-hydrolase [Myxococcales bacterium]